MISAKERLTSTILKESWNITLYYMLPIISLDFGIECDNYSMLFIFMISVLQAQNQAKQNRPPRCSKSGRLGRRPQRAATNSRHLPHLSSRHRLSEPLVAHEDGDGRAFEAGLLLGSDGVVFCA